MKVMLPQAKTVAVAGLVAVLMGCDRKAERPAQETGDAAPAAGAGLVAGTPAGDLEEWIAEVQSGLDSVTQQTGVNAAEMHRRVLDLYVSRQEYIEMYYGPGGRLTPTPQLSEAVKLAETRFHEIMRLTGSTPAAEATAISKAIGELKTQYAIVLNEAKRTPTRLREAAGSAQ
jgi:acetyl-CoA carboxylase alpha subunit